MKKVSFISVFLCLLLLVSCAEEAAPSAALYDMIVTEVKAGREESYFSIEAGIPGTDFSEPGDILRSEIVREWDEFSKMTEEQRPVNDHLWGVVEIQADSWEECEKAVGVQAHNPIEYLGWLSPDTTGVCAVATTSSDMTVREIRISAGYSFEDIGVTLTATLCSEDCSYSTGYSDPYLATYEQQDASTGTGFPVLVFIPHVTNNNGYASEDFDEVIAFCICANVLYTMRVYGSSEAHENIQAVLDRILAEI